MSFYRNRVYPHIVTVLGNPKPMQKIRQQVVPLAQGFALEVGVGPGVNFAYYDPSGANFGVKCRNRALLTRRVG
jgi:hypothetical protein